ncbi:MAG: discoidin domain-containing protein [Holosporaceae bacterium]|jgi:hypothetical protein|nr:discoidin domain-containing protein [Holosporaceae bacterium]
MIDEKTEHKNYPLPHPENIASQDVERIATAIEMTDADVNACATAIEGIQETVQELDAKSLRIPSSLVGTINTELSDLEPRRYIVVNNDATGFSTVEGGGGEGGLTGEVLAKRSNFNFDTMWVDPRAVSKKAAVVNEVDADYQLKNNNVVILADAIEIDNGDQLPRVGLTQRQILNDVISDSQYTYILCDEIDDSAPDESDIATSEKFGRVMIGSGIDLNNGKISVPTPTRASTEVFGVVKIGSGIDVNDGVISAPSYQQADHENFGTVKLSSDFKTGNSGELLLANKKDVEEIVYQAANADVALNNCIIPKSNFAKYRLFINEDSLITFDWSQIIIEKDLAFDLEIISDGTYIISFDANIIWTLPCSGVLAGKTIIRFERKYGSTTLYGNLKSSEAKFIVDLTTSTEDDIQPNFICGHNGCAWNASRLLVKTGDYMDSASGTGEAIWYIDFMRSTLINSLEQHFGGEPVAFFYIEGSVDRQNWKKLFARESSTFSEGHIYLTNRGFFRHYRLRASTTFRFFWLRWHGYSVDDELFELVRVMPLMPNANSINGFSITSSGTNDGALYYLTQNSVGNWVNLAARLNGEFWIKYELPEAAIVNLIDICAPNGYSDRMPTRFKIEASNDDEDWTLLLERASLIRWYDGESRQYHIDNHTVYKFYKFTPIEIPSTQFRIARFRLYRKIAGQGTLDGFVPIMTGTSQGGYEITFSSEASGDRAYYAFDGNNNSQWTTANGAAQNSWICIRIVSGGIVDLDENVAIYRAFLNEDLQFSFHLGFDPQADFSFWLEIISDGEHLIDFVEEISGGISGVNRGITRIKFTKLLGSSKWNAEANVLEAPEPILLTLNNGDHIKSGLRLSCNGSDWDTYGMLGTDVGNVGFQNNPREVYFDFAKSAVVDRVYFHNGNTNALSLFELLGSNDKIGWIRLLYKADSIIERNTPTEKKGAFHYFKLRFSNEGNVRGIQLWGSIIDNDDSELILLTPQMSSDSIAGITISCSNLRWNNVRDVTSPSVNSAIELDKGSSPEPWIQYEFAEPKVANFLDTASQQSNTHRTARRFRLIASGDGEEWDLLLEREYQEDWKQGETRYFEFENETAYKYYRLVCSYTSDGSNPFIWRISRFRLFRRESGTSSFINALPPLISANQDGYEVSANSEADSGHVAVNAFDENADTKWATTDGNHLNSWLKIKLPEATAFNAAHLQARNDNSYGQAPSIFKIQASNDDETWTDLTYETASWSQKEAKIFYWFNETPFLYYRLLIESVQSGIRAGLAEFHLGRRAKTYRRHLNKYDNVVPIMTSDATEGADGTYLLSSSSEHSGHRRIYLFDHRFDTRFELNGEGSGWVQVELPIAKFINVFAVGARSDDWRDAAPRNYELVGSNNGSDWTPLFSIADSPAFSHSELRTHQLNHSASYKFYRLNIGNSNRGSVLSFSRWDLIIKDMIVEY